MLQINVGKLSKVYHSMCRSFIPFEPPIVSFESDAKPDDGDSKDLYEQLGRPATPFHDAIPARAGESETDLASLAISTSGLAPSILIESRTPSGCGGMSDRTAIRSGIPDGGYRSSFAAIKSEIGNVVPSSSNETLLSEFSSSVNDGYAGVSESNETVSTKSRETEPIPVSPSNSDILRMLLPSSEPSQEASYAPEEHKPFNDQPEWKYNPQNDFPGVPMTAPFDKSDKDRETSESKHSRHRHSSPDRREHRHRRSLSPKSADDEKEQRRRSYKARKHGWGHSEASKPPKRRHSPEDDQDYRHRSSSSSRKSTHDSYRTNRPHRRPRSPSPVSQAPSYPRRQRSPSPVSPEPLRYRSDSSRRQRSPSPRPRSRDSRVSIPAKRSRIREISPIRHSDRNHNTDKIYEYLPNPNDLQYRTSVPRRQSVPPVSPKLEPIKSEPARFAKSTPIAPPMPDLSEIMNAMSTALPQRVADAFPPICHEKKRFCQKCNRHISFVCRSVDAGQVCRYGRRCGFLHPLCYCTQPGCWMDHLDYPKLCVACREKTKLTEPANIVLTYG